MPTLSDLREVFADLERHAPDPHPLGLPAKLPPRERQGPDRRTWIAAALVSAAVVAVSVGVALGGTTPHRQAAGATAPPATGPTGQHVSNDQSGTKSSAAATATAGHPSSGPSPVQISGLPGLRVTDLDSSLRSGDLVVQDGVGGQWTFGWGNTELNPADKPDTHPARIDGRSFIVYPNRGASGLFGVGVNATGFGMTITAVGHDYTLAQYRPFLAHVHFSSALGDRSTWFASAIGD